jgi:hypothetical protein
MSRTYIPIALRRQVYERAQGCCEYCLIPDVATFTSIVVIELRNARF